MKRLINIQFAQCPESWQTRAGMTVNPCGAEVPRPRAYVPVGAPRRLRWWNSVRGGDTICYNRRHSHKSDGHRHDTKTRHVYSRYQRTRGRLARASHRTRNGFCSFRGFQAGVLADAALAAAQYGPVLSNSTRSGPCRCVNTGGSPGPLQREIAGIDESS